MKNCEDAPAISIGPNEQLPKLDGLEQHGDAKGCGQAMKKCVSDGGIGAAMVALMKNSFRAQKSRALEITATAILAVTFLSISACSKTDVNLAAQPSPQPENAKPEKTAAERLVEIDQLLAAAPTGRPEDSDRRTALRAEREALIASGRVPYRNVPQSFTSRVANTPPNNTVTQRLPNGNVINNAVPTTRTEPITVAQDSQAKNLSFLEQMTPSERERYLKAIKVQNTQRVEVDVRHH